MTSASPIKMLAWDSEFFGMPTGRIDVRLESEGALLLALQEARTNGLRILYWLAQTDLSVANALHTFSGRRIAGHAVYERSLDSSLLVPSDRAFRSLAVDFPVNDVLPLALLAGHLSRFRLDGRLPAGSFEKLYALWIARSLKREIATDVLAFFDSEGLPSGLATYTISSDRVSTVGLISTATQMQRKGLASDLLALVERDSLQQGAHTIRVSTQTENLAACRLYEKRGYRLVDGGNYYHFLPQGEPA